MAGPVVPPRTSMRGCAIARAGRHLLSVQPHAPRLRVTSSSRGTSATAWALAPRARTAGGALGGSAGIRGGARGSKGAVAASAAGGGRPKLSMHDKPREGPGSMLSTFDGDVLQGRFVIEADEVKEVCEETGLTPIDLLRSLIGPAQQLAIPPISNFHVGAVGLGESGRIFIGVNVEFSGVPLLHSIHAEQFLVINALRSGEKKLQYIALSAAPCGHCRQFCAELFGSDDLQFLFRGSPADSLSHLLPWRFGPADLHEGDEDPVLLLEDRCNGLVLEEGAVGAVVEAIGDAGLAAQALEMAFTQADRSYTPYSHHPCGVALVAADGRVFGGGGVESAAYNPTLGPLQTAVIDAAAHGVRDWTQIAHAVLVELEDGQVMHEDTIRLVLLKNAPGCTVTVVHATHT